MIYNLMAATFAFWILPFFAMSAEVLSPGVAARQPEILLVSFHSFFNTVCVLSVLPFTNRFAGLIERLVPDRPRPFTERLDRRLLQEPDVALRALAPTLCDLAGHTFEILRQRAMGAPISRAQSERCELLSIALDDVQGYLASMAPAAESSARAAAALHIVDQLRRLLARMAQVERVAALSRDRRLSEVARSLGRAIPDAPAGSLAELLHNGEIQLAELCAELEVQRASFREEVAHRVAASAIDSAFALSQMDAYRWLERSAHHAWRIAHHLGQLIGERPTPLIVEPPEPD